MSSLHVSVTAQGRLRMKRHVVAACLRFFSPRALPLGDGFLGIRSAELDVRILITAACLSQR